MTGPGSPESIVHHFRLAAGREDVAALAALIHPEVIALTDSAGDVVAPTYPVHGSPAVIGEAIANLSITSGAVVTEQLVNAAPALVVRRDTRVVAVVSFGVSDGLIRHVWITRSPQKLARWNANR